MRYEDDNFIRRQELTQDQIAVIRIIQGGSAAYYDDRLTLKKYVPAIIKLIHYGLVVKVDDELTLTPEGEDIARRI